MKLEESLLNSAEVVAMLFETVSFFQIRRRHFKGEDVFMHDEYPRAWHVSIIFPHIHHTLQRETA